MWLAGVIAIMIGGTRPDGYLIHVLGQPLPHPYPWNGVLFLIAIVTVESLVLYAILRPLSYRAAWGRALLALGVFLSLMAWFALGLMHAPPYLAWHVLWLLAVNTGLLVLAARSGLAAMRLRR